MFTPELSAAFAACAEHDRISGEVNLAVAAEKAANSQLDKAKRRLWSEESDVAELESVTFARIWASVRGTRVEDVERERAQASLAEADVATLEAAATAARENRQRLQYAIAELGDVYARREQALTAEEGRLLDAGGAAAAQLVEIAGQLASVASQRAELVKAKGACRTATVALTDAANELGSADGWSTYDTFFGGGMISSSIKHDHLDAARSQLSAAAAALKRLSAALAQLGLAGVASLDVDDLTRGFDIWFDNFLTDWLVGDQISEARGRTEEALAAVAAATNQLDGQARALDTLEATLAQAREAVITQR